MEFLVVFLDGEVAALVDHGDGVVDVGPVVGEGGGGDLYAVEFPQVEVGLFQHLDEEGRGAAGEPVVLEHGRVQHVEYAERVVDAHHIAIVEMVPVIHPGEAFHACLVVEVIFFGQ